MQIVGRGLRIAAGKTDCMILDHSDTTARLGFVTDIDHDNLDYGRQVNLHSSGGGSAGRLGGIGNVPQHVRDAHARFGMGLEQSRAEAPSHSGGTCVSGDGTAERYAVLDDGFRRIYPAGREGQRTPMGYQRRDAGGPRGTVDGALQSLPDQDQTRG